MNRIKREHLNELALNMLTRKYIKQQIGRKRVNFTLTIREKGLFCKDSFMMSQTERARCTNNVLDFDDNNSDKQSVQSAKYYHENQVQLCRSTRQQFTYQSFQEESKCIICPEIKKDNQLLGRKEAWEFVSQDTNTSTIKEDFKLASHFSNMDLLGDETMTLDDIFLKRRNRKKQMDTEEGDIENESDNKELTSKEKWEESLIRIMRTRKPEYKLSVQELNQRKEEIRQRWQVAYDQVKKNRLVVKNKKVKEQAMQNGVTLVKFLPKSQQAKYIKEAQFQRQYCL